jgi:FkbM family methyltransferase
MDYVLPFRQRNSRTDVIRLAARSPSAAGRLHFGRQSFAVDRVAYFGIFLERWYQADYSGAVVVDVGAHKGYFGAYALLEGASAVHSFEPEPENLALLEQTAASFGKPWVVHAAAVGSTAGTAVLHVSAESAGHSLVHTESQGSRATLRSESVTLVPMAGILAEACATGSSVIVKIDAEGAECDIVLGTPVEAWERVERVFLETHHFAPCATADIVEHLGRAGLRLTLRVMDDGAELVHLVR